MTKTYKIKQTFVFVWMVSLLGTIFLGIGLMMFLIKIGLIPNVKEQPIIMIVVAIAFIFFAFKVPNYVASVDIELTIDSEGLKKKWLRQFFFLNKQDIVINWTEIKNYVFQPDRQFDLFKLTLKNGKKIKLSHNNDHYGKDDFQIFQLDFEKKVAKLNSDRDKSNDIKRGKTIYETVWGLILAIIGIVMIVAIITMVLFFPAKKETNYALLGASIIGAIYFIFQVYEHRKKNKVK